MEKHYLKKFDNQNDYESQKNEVMAHPHIALIADTDTLIFVEEFVDLGLPSGTLWATKAIGAETEEDFGLYFAWGNTEGATKNGIESGEFTFGTYGNMVKYIDTATEVTFTKYNATDGKKELDLEDDAVHAHMGDDWHMPTKEQCEELIENTTSTWTVRNGVNGRLFTSKMNGKSVFVPAAGRVVAEGMMDINKYAYIPTKNLYDGGTDVRSFYALYSKENETLVNTNERISGFPIRAVK